jgi:hypothetical protein
MSRREDTFLDDVRDAKPPVRPSADEWVDSERGRRVLERVLAADRATGARGRAKHSRTAWWAGPRLVFAAGALIVVVLAVALAVVFAGRGTDQGGVTQSTAPTAEQVTGAAAVADLMPLYRLKSSSDIAPTGNGTVSQVEQAVALGLVTREAALGAWATSPMTQGDYAVLLVKAFGSILPQGTFPEQQIDARSTPTERQATSALMTSGIILPQDGGFAAGQTLTKEVEDRLLGRVEQAYSRLIKE